MLKKIRPLVFWPTFSILVAALLLSFINLSEFIKVTSSINTVILNNFSWLFSFGSFYLLCLIIITYFSPLSSIKIGGEKAKPLISKMKWFTIVLCTTLAVGVLFWTTAEPIYHLHYPPKSLGFESGSADAALFSISTMFLHWGPTPYAIYAVPALVFAIAFYNLDMPFSISSLLRPILGKHVLGKKGQLIDALALYSLVVGMASSLGTGALTLVGGLGEFFNITKSPVSLGIVILIIVLTFVFSAVSGLINGIAKLSAINAWALLALFIFMLIVGPTAYILSIGVEGIGAYLNNFFRMSLFTGAAANDNWSQSWSIFYWSIWFAWAPVTAMFLGKISKGYTVREFIQINVFYPSLFIILWVSVFSGTSIYLDMNSNGYLNQVLTEQGIEKLLYYIIGNFPMSKVVIFFLLFIAFISYVTAADSSTDAIGDLCTKDFTSKSDQKTGVGIKITWGTIIGLVAWIMVSTVGVDGVKSLSNLGGLPATLIVLACSLTLVYWLKNYSLVKKD